MGAGQGCSEPNLRFLRMMTVRKQTMTGGLLRKSSGCTFWAFSDRPIWRIGGGHGAAIILGLHPNTLRSRMKKLELTRRADNA